jgi:hypothetical protein
MKINLIKLLIFLLISIINYFEGNTSTCSSETFYCSINGNCIPLDWVGDGEPDCEDGADEKQNNNKRFFFFYIFLKINF